MATSRTLSTLPLNTARLRDHLDTCPRSDLRYYAICAEQTPNLPTHQDFKAWQIDRAMARRDVTVVMP